MKNIILAGIIDLNISPKDTKISTSSLKSLAKKMKENGVVKYAMPQIEQKIVSDSQLTLLESLDSNLIQTISGIHENGLTEIATLSNRISAIFIESDSDKNLLRRVFQYAKMKHKPIICKIQNRNLDGDGIVFDNPNSFFLGLPTKDRLAERIETASIIEMVKYFNVPTLIQNVTDIESIELIDSAKKNGVPLLLEMSIHHLIFDDSIYTTFNNYSKINPPFQSKNGKNSLLQILKDGKIDMLTSLHHKVSESEKSGSFKEADSGVVGLESIFAIYYTKLVLAGYLDLESLENLISKNQAKFLGIELPPKIEVSLETPVTIIDKDSLYYQQTLFGQIKI